MEHGFTRLRDFFHQANSWFLLCFDLFWLVSLLQLLLFTEYNDKIKQPRILQLFFANKCSNVSPVYFIFSLFSSFAKPPLSPPPHVSFVRQSPPLQQPPPMTKKNQQHRQPPSSVCERVCIEASWRYCPGDPGTRWPRCRTGTITVSMWPSYTSSHFPPPQG